jgi:hypothetical protein
LFLCLFLPFLVSHTFPFLSLTLYISLSLSLTYTDTHRCTNLLSFLYSISLFYTQGSLANNSY